MSLSTLRRRAVGGTLAAAAVAALALVAPLTASAAPPYPSDTAKPSLTPLLAGYNAYWQKSTDATHPFAGTVLDAATLSRNDELATWINNNATAGQQFRALQDALYRSGTAGPNGYGTDGYDQAYTVSQGLGTRLSQLYVYGLNNDLIPKTEALINSSNGSTGAYVSTSQAKGDFSYPRPYLTGNTSTANYDTTNCPAATINSTALGGIRSGAPYATNGSLNIHLVGDQADASGEFRSGSVPLSAGYATAGLCTGGSFPSGHTTTAYEAGITLATLLPDFAPELLARASEAGNNRIVLGVHYPLDIMGGRIDGEVALATRWSDAQFRSEVIEPARAELVNYLLSACGTTTLLACAATGTTYQDDPYNGAAMPGGTNQKVTDRASALAVYTERLTYGFPQSGATGLAASVPDGASNLLLTTFPTLTDAQRTSVLAQTELPSGYPLDLTSSGGAAWERLNLAAAMSAVVQLNADGSATVVSTGGAAQVLAAPAPAATTPVRLPVVSG